MLFDVLLPYHYDTKCFLVLLILVLPCSYIHWYLKFISVNLYNCFPYYRNIIIYSFPSCTCSCNYFYILCRNPTISKKIIIYTVSCLFVDYYYYMPRVTTKHKQITYLRIITVWQIP